MTKRLINELQRIKLSLNIKKSETIGSNPDDDHCILNFLEIENGFIKIRHGIDSHRYIGRQLCLFCSDRINLEIQNQSLAAWGTFHKYKDK